MKAINNLSTSGLPVMTNRGLSISGSPHIGSVYSAVVHPPPSSPSPSTIQKNPDGNSIFHPPHCSPLPNQKKKCLPKSAQGQAMIQNKAVARVIAEMRVLCDKVSTNAYMSLLAVPQPAPATSVKGRELCSK